MRSRQHQTALHIMNTMESVVFFTLLCLGANGVPADFVSVTVPNIGIIVGKTLNLTLPDGQKSSVTAFKGIPYAEPPIGELRFAKPVLKVNITSPFEAFRFGEICPQISKGKVKGSEDCLYLNVYVPYASFTGRRNNHENVQTRLENIDMETRLPVLVWIHGGSFQIGSSRRDTGRLVAFGNIVIVTISYRLGALGFFSTEDQQAPGNFGLWDQRMAILWVKNNIAAFGGDPDKITIGGGSAGAFSVTSQALYPQNQGLFQRFIAASGSAVSVLLLRKTAAIYGPALWEKLGCKLSSTEEIVNCLRQKNISDIVGTPINPIVPFDVVWVPTPDGDFIPELPTEQVGWPLAGPDLPHLQAVDAMFATTAAEGMVSVDMFVRPLASAQQVSLNKGVPKQLYLQVIDTLLLSLNESAEKTIANAIDYEYRDWQDPSNLATLGQSTVDLLTDRHWFVPNVVFCRNHAANNSHTKTYLLDFDLPKQYSGGPTWLTGALHVGYDAYAWGLPGRRLNLSSDSDGKMWDLSKALMTYWSNFVKTGDPSNPVKVKEPWLPFTLEDEYYLDINFDVISAQKHCKAKRTQFWLDYIPKVRDAMSFHDMQSAIPGNGDYGSCDYAFATGLGAIGRGATCSVQRSFSYILTVLAWNVLATGIIC